MPTLVTFYIRNCAIGFALSAVFVGGLAAFDVMGLGALFAGSAHGLFGAFLLWFFCGTIFAGAQTGAALFTLSEEDDRPGPRGGRLEPVRVPVVQPRRKL